MSPAPERKEEKKNPALWHYIAALSISAWILTFIFANLGADFQFKYVPLWLHQTIAWFDIGAPFIALILFGVDVFRGAK